MGEPIGNSSGLNATCLLLSFRQVAKGHGGLSPASDSGEDDEEEEEDDDDGD